MLSLGKGCGLKSLSHPHNCTSFFLQWTVASLSCLCYLNVSALIFSTTILFAYLTNTLFTAASVYIYSNVRQCIFLHVTMYWSLLIVRTIIPGQYFTCCVLIMIVHISNHFLATPMITIMFLIKKRFSCFESNFSFSNISYAGIALCLCVHILLCYVTTAKL